MVQKGVHYTKRYARFRIRNPKKFVSGSLRTHDPGRKGHTKRIAGRLKKNNRWATQAILITRSDYKKKTPAVKRTLQRIKYMRKRAGR